MSASTLTIRMDDELKRSAADVAEYYGLDLSSVVRAVFKQMVNTGRIPLTFAPEEPNGESLNAAAEADSFMASGKTCSKRRCADGPVDRRLREGLQPRSEKERQTA